ncbi:MAG: DUF1176 domain-containing protein [Myxococcota bacterium]
MRSFIILAALVSIALACSGAPEIDETPPPPPTPAPETPPKPDTTQKPAGVGPLCPDDLEPIEQRRIPVEDGLALIEVSCEMFAYQGRFIYWLERDGQRQPAVAGGGLDLLGFPGFDPADRTITNLSKYRGPGDCGEWLKFKLEGERFVLKEHRIRECDDNADFDNIPSPDQWPLVGPNVHRRPSPP